MRLLIAQNFLFVLSRRKVHFWRRSKFMQS